MNLHDTKTIKCAEDEKDILEVQRVHCKGEEMLNLEVIAPSLRGVEEPSMNLNIETAKELREILNDFIKTVEAPKGNKFTRIISKAFSTFAIHTYMSLTVFTSAIAYGYQGETDKALLFTAIAFIISSLSPSRKEGN